MNEDKDHFSRKKKKQESAKVLAKGRWNTELVVEKGVSKYQQRSHDHIQKWKHKLTWVFYHILLRMYVDR